MENIFLVKIQTNVMHQSIPAVPSPGPPNFLGVETLKLSNPPGWGRKKRANAPSFVNTATFFVDRTIEECHFKHFNVRFFVSINVFLSNSAILIKTWGKEVGQHIKLLVELFHTASELFFPYSSSQCNVQSIAIIVCSSFMLTDAS